MARVDTSQVSFNAGEVSRLALARVDVEKLQFAAECQVNWLPHVLGPMMLRPGLKYLGSTKSDAAAKFIPFIFSNDDTALIELTDSHMRIWVDDALLTVASVSTTITNGDFSSATGWTLSATDGAGAASAASSSAISGGFLKMDAYAYGSNAYAERAVTVAGADQNVVHRLRITIVRGLATFQIGSTSGGEEYFARTTLGVGVHSIAFTPTGATFYPRLSTKRHEATWVDSIVVESSGTLDVSAPWTASDLDFVRTTQSGDIVYVACDGFQPRQIERRDNNSWSIVLFDFRGGPFISPADWTNGIILDPDNGGFGQWHLTSTSAYFTSDMVNSLIRLNHNNQSRSEQVAAGGFSTMPFRVTGAFTFDRSFVVTFGGTWTATITLEVSQDGPDFGFSPYTTYSANGANTVDDHAYYPNKETWYRCTIKTGDYTSGFVTVAVGYGGSPNVGENGYLKIIAYNSSTSVDVHLFGVVSNESTPDFLISEWSDAQGWPSAVALFDGRLWFAGSDRLWGSVSDDYTNFDDQTVGDSGPIARSVGSGPIAITNWLLPLTRLIIGCEGSEFSVRSSAFDEPITPTNFTLKECSTHGSSNLPALKIDTSGVFVEKSGRRIYKLSYNAQIIDYDPIDLTALNPDIGLNGFVRLDVQRQPDTVMHFVTGLGQVACYVEDTASRVGAWWRAQTLGVVEDVVILPGSLEDSVYYVVKRTINGSTKRYLEKFAQRTQCQGGALSRNIDSHLVISQASSTTISGLSHLEGESVVVWANGKDLGSYTVASGSITVSEAVTSAIVGLGGVSFSYDNSTASATLTCDAKYNGYPAEVFADGRHIGPIAVASGLVTLPNGRTAKKITAYLGLYAPFRSAKLAYGAQLGTALTQPKKVEKLGLILYDTHYQGVTYGSSPDNLQPLPLVEGGQDTAADTVWTDYDRPMVGLSGSWDTDSRLHLLAAAPRPAMVAGAVIAVTTNEAR